MGRSHYAASCISTYVGTQQICSTTHGHLQQMHPDTHLFGGDMVTMASNNAIRILTQPFRGVHLNQKHQVMLLCRVMSSFMISF